MLTVSRLSTGVDDFLEAMKAQGKSQRTVEDAYRSPLIGIFLPWAEGVGILDVTEVTKAHLSQLAIELYGRKTRKGTPLAKASVATYLRTINVFLSWAQKEGQIPERIVAPLPKRERKHRDVLSRDEVRDLEAAAPRERDKLIIRLLADTGAREGELAHMTVDDVVKKGRGTYVRLRGKTGERVCPVTPAVHARLDEYARRGRPRGLDSPSLWISDRRRAGGNYEPLGEAGIYKVVKGAAYRIGLERRIYPHLLRHSAITNLVNHGMHPATISEITGVSVEVIAQHYTHSTDEDRYAALMKVLGT